MPEILVGHQAIREHRAPTNALVARQFAKIPPPATMATTSAPS
jgi:hypothetical protein